MFRNFVRYNRDRKMLSIGSRIWMFTKVVWDEDSWRYDDGDPGTRQFVIHVFRLHVTIDWWRG